MRGVVELRFGLDGAGGRCDLIVDQAQAALAQRCTAVVGIADKGLDPGRLLGRKQFVEQGQLLLGQGELHGNGINLGHGKQPLGIADPQEIACIHRTNAHAPADRRLYLRIGQLHLRGRNGCLVTLCRSLELIDQGLLLIEGLPGHAIVHA